MLRRSAVEKGGVSPNKGGAHESEFDDTVAPEALSTGGWAEEEGATPDGRRIFGIDDTSIVVVLTQTRSIHPFHQHRFQSTVVLYTSSTR